MQFDAARPPSGFLNHPDLGILLGSSMTAQMIHAWPDGKDFCGEARAMKAPNGDYLVMFAAGPGHYGFSMTKRNQMVMYRSSDRGKSWSGPTLPWDVPYSQHGLVPLISHKPNEAHRMYAFGTEPRFDLFDGKENAPIGMRYSDDNGRSWSQVEFISPTNDPFFCGMFVMRACETASGAWLLAPHVAQWTDKSVSSWLYAMRSPDQGKTWQLLPQARPNGWVEPQYMRLEEGRPIAVSGSHVMILARTATGHLWALHSHDDGQTWSKPAPTPLVHPSAPPMIFHLSDGKTLAAFHHNRYSGIDKQQRSGNVGEDRSELWVSTSRDGYSWTEPRFVLANSAEPVGATSSWAWSVSYVDALFDQGLATLIISHQHKRVHIVQFPEELLSSLPTRAELRSS
jgi:BNR repeat-like domain